MDALPQNIETSATASEHISKLLESDVAVELAHERLRKSERENLNLRVVISEMSDRIAQIESLTKSLYAARDAHRLTETKYTALAKILVSVASVFKQVESDIASARDDIEKELPAWKNGMKKLLKLLESTSMEVQAAVDVVSEDVGVTAPTSLQTPAGIALRESREREKKLETELSESKKRERVLQEKIAELTNGSKQTVSATQQTKADLVNAYLNGATWAFNHGSQFKEEFNELLAGMADPLKRQ